MPAPLPADGEPRVLDAADLESLFGALRRRGLRILGPRVRDGAVVLEELRSAADLPRGTRDEQAPGRYRLHPSEEDLFFGFAVGPQGFKQHLFPPRQRLVQLRRKGQRFEAEAEPPPAERWALLGARACDLAAIAVQDRVFTGGAQKDPHYEAARRRALLIAVECTRAAATCFCASVGTGPEASAPHDLKLTEVLDGDAHYFVCCPGSSEGAELLAELPTRAAGSPEREAAAAHVRRAAQEQTRRLPQDGLRDALFRAVAEDHPRWDEVAERCLGCGSCTLVCPTCFCATIEDQASLDGASAERWRRWDSCFSGDHSALHGVPIRGGIRSRYRQWLTHKLAGWVDQFGTSGCVGCGRCIAWCPVGIDLTEECAALRTREVPHEPR
jgi:sulfhydrogenase subunit beta (sulfur reductase)